MDAATLEEAIVVFISGIFGVFLVMALLQVGISLSSKLAIWIESRDKEKSVSSGNG